MGDPLVVHCATAKEAQAEPFSGERLWRLERKIMEILLLRSGAVGAVEECIQAICEEFSWLGGAYWKLDEDSGALVEFAGWPRSNPARLPTADSSSAPSVSLTDDPIWINTFTARELKKALVTTSWLPPSPGLFVPVRSVRGVTGFISLQCPAVGADDAQVLDTLTALASSIGRFCERARANERLLETGRRFVSTVALAAIGIAHVDDTGRFMYANPELCRMLGYESHELVGLSIAEVSHPQDVNATDSLRDRLRSGEIDSFKIEKRYLRKDGTSIWVALTIAAMRDGEGQRICDISVAEDITPRKSAEEQVQYLATHDGLTGLPNRILFSQQLSVALDHSERQGTRLAVLFIDLDRFKTINDSMGHEAGDLLLYEVAARLRECLRGSDVVARLGGDEFVVLLRQVAGRGQAAVVAKHILSSVMRPMLIQGIECRVTASIGICLHPVSGRDDRDVMKCADIAMYAAKEDGKNTFQFYSPEKHTLSAGRLAIETQLRKALDQNEFSLHYQAKVDVKTDTITGVEALLRWNNKELGSLPPTYFIPVAEESGLIVPIGSWVLRTACAQNAKWLKEGLPQIRVCVNLSLRQLEDPGIVQQIRGALSDSGLPPELLELELTESMVMHNTERSIRVLSKIKSLGIRLAIDDFGTGYSSLAQLKQFPIDTLKVDRSFIRDIPRDAEDRAITEAIISMAKTLSLTVVAEGVESPEQKAFLRQQSCDEMQGYYFSTPVPPEEFAALLRTHRLAGK